MSNVDESSREKYIGDDEIEELLGIDVNNSDADEDYVSRIFFDSDDFFSYENETEDFLEDGTIDIDDCEERWNIKRLSGWNYSEAREKF